MLLHSVTAQVEQQCKARGAAILCVLQRLAQELTTRVVLEDVQQLRLRVEV